MDWHYYYKVSKGKTEIKYVNNELNTSSKLPLSQTEFSSKRTYLHFPGAPVWVSLSHLTPQMTHFLLPQLPKLAHLCLSSKQQFPSHLFKPSSDPLGTITFSKLLDSNAQPSLPWTSHTVSFILLYLLLKITANEQI